MCVLRTWHTYACDASPHIYGTHGSAAPCQTCQCRHAAASAYPCLALLPAVEKTSRRWQDSRGPFKHAEQTSIQPAALACHAACHESPPNANPPTRQLAPVTSSLTSKPGPSRVRRRRQKTCCSTSRGCRVIMPLNGQRWKLLRCASRCLVAWHRFFHRPNDCIHVHQAPPTHVHYGRPCAAKRQHQHHQQGVQGGVPHAPYAIRPFTSPLSTAHAQKRPAHACPPQGPAALACGSEWVRPQQRKE